MSTLRRRMGIWVAGLVLLAADLSLAHGQEAANPEPQIARCYARKAKFFLPLAMSDGLKAQIREINLYYKNPLTGGWTLLEKCPPTQPGFDFLAPKEGEYWFTMTMVTTSGQTIPAAPELSPNCMVVVVDMQSPTADVRLVQNAKEGQIVQVEVRDANLDSGKTQVWYQTKDQNWRPLEALEPNRYCIPVQAATTGFVRVNATDLAGNTMQRDFDLALGNAGQSVPESAGTTASAGILPSPAEPAPPSREPNPPRTAPSVSFDSGDKPPQATNKVITIGAKAAPSELGGVIRIPGNDPFNKKNEIIVQAEQTQGAPNTPSTPIVAPQSAVNVPDPRISNVKVILPETSVGFKLPPPAATEPPTMPAKAAESATPVEKPSAPISVNRQLINRTQMLLTYKVDQVGVSGVGKVEVWITRDQGKTWQKHFEDPHCKNPLTIELPGEGLYGLSLVVANGRGFSEPAPVPGDAPDSWVEVDLTKPTAEITSIRSGTGDDAGGLMIGWRANDRNLSADAVELYWATRRDGAWTLLAKGLKNEGTHRWVPPTNLGQSVFIRMMVRDLAGNVTIVETPQAVSVDDMSRPRGRLVGVSPVTPGAEIRLDATGN